MRPKSLDCCTIRDKILRSYVQHFLELLNANKSLDKAIDKVKGERSSC